MCSKNKEYNIVTSYSPEALFISSFALVFPMHFTESELKYAEYTAEIFSICHWKFAKFADFSKF